MIMASYCCRPVGRVKREEIDPDEMDPAMLPWELPADFPFLQQYDCADDALYWGPAQVGRCLCFPGSKGSECKGKINNKFL